MGAGRQVKRLFDLEIDEVSLVDRPANQFGKVAFSKRAEEDMPELFDVDGQPVDEEDLEHGDAVFDGDGNQLVWIEEGSPEFEALAADVDSAFDDEDGDFDDDQVDEYDDEDADERELASVGKRHSRRVSKAGMKFTSEAGEFVGRSRRGERLRGHVSRNRYRYGAGAAGAAGAEGVRRRVKKSYGQSVYEELSKALTSRDRDQAISKALDVVDELAAQNEELYEIVGKMADEKALEDFSALAQEYGPLPVHPARLGAIMKRAADTLPREDVQILDRLFTSVGDQLYTEIGKAGTGASVEVMDQVEAFADELVGKSDLSREQAVTAIFAENPEAYDEYLADSGQLR